MKKNLCYILALLIVSLSPNTILSQGAPNLNTADSFVLFTATGQFTSNSPSTIVVGNVGNAVGAVSAFPPGFLSGSRHFGDATATQAAIDITNAYADLASRVCGTVHGVGFGGGETLTPGVYCAGAASTLNGNVTLDAGGNSAAVFIIKIDGAFASVAGSQIVLINSATACNVFWQINGQVDLVNTVFRGTMLVNGAINLVDGTIIDGRALTKAGSLIFGSVNASICDITILPLQLVNFEVAKTTGNNVEVSWITASEINVSGFEVQVSVNGSPFVKIGTVSSKGNSFPTQYSLQDLQTNKTGVRFYRLKMIDRDGSTTYSLVKSLKFADLTVGLIKIFPNPAGNTINISVNAETKEHIALTIVNMHGQKLIQKTWLVEKGITNLVQNIRNLTKATYIVSIKNISTGEETRQNFQKL
ncbi:MAG: ice-binding family protein [Ginsengibacter sp.]